MPVESINDRLLLAFLPVLTVLLFFGVAALGQRRWYEALVALVFSFFLLTLFFAPAGLFADMYRLPAFNTDWVPSVISDLEASDVPTSTLVLATHNQLPLAVYSQYPTQLIWALRCDFLMQYQNRLVLINNFAVDVSRHLLPADASADKLLECFSHGKLCKTKLIGTVRITDCLPQAHDE